MIVPVTATRPDWPRIVSQAVKEHDGRLSALEAPETITIKPGSAPAAPAEGMIYYDAAAHKLKCWDGMAWQALW